MKSGRSGGSAESGEDSQSSSSSSRSSSSSSGSADDSLSSSSGSDSSASDKKKTSGRRVLRKRPRVDGQKEEAGYGSAAEEKDPAKKPLDPEEQERREKKRDKKRARKLYDDARKAEQGRRNERRREQSDIDSDADLADVSAKFVNKKREEQRTQILKVLKGLFAHRGLGGGTELQSLVPQQMAAALERRCYELARSKVDEAFRTRITNVIRNVLLLRRDAVDGAPKSHCHHKEICDLLFVEKKGNEKDFLFKLAEPHPEFRDLVAAWSERLRSEEDRRQRKLRQREGNQTGSKKGDVQEQKGRAEGSGSDAEAYLQGPELARPGITGPSTNMVTGGAGQRKDASGQPQP